MALLSKSRIHSSCIMILLFFHVFTLTLIPVSICFVLPLSFSCQQAQGLTVPQKQHINIQKHIQLLSSAFLAQNKEALLLRQSYIAIRLALEAPEVHLSEVEVVEYRSTCTKRCRLYVLATWRPSHLGRFSWRLNSNDITPSTQSCMELYSPSRVSFKVYY